MGRTFRYDPEDEEDYFDDIGFCEFCNASHASPNNDSCRKSFRLEMIGNDITEQGATPGLVQEAIEVMDEEAEAA